MVVGHGDGFPSTCHLYVNPVQYLLASCMVVRKLFPLFLLFSVIRVGIPHLILSDLQALKLVHY